MNKFSVASKHKLETCHPLLQRLMAMVLEKIDITIICGYRDKIAQEVALTNGTSKLHWPNSKHNTYPSMAVDVAPYPIDWNDYNAFRLVSYAVKQCWKEIPDDEKEGLELNWGGDWTRFKDHPHYELVKGVEAK